MDIFGMTDKGVVRQMNQDSYAHGKKSESLYWAAVCDGMGGARGGDYASRTAAEEIAKVLSEAAISDTDSAAEALKQAIEAANLAVFEASKTDEALMGMGTTVVAAVVVEDELVLAHAGDSRAYILSDDVISQATTDHSLVQEMVDSGDITEEEARIHPRRNVITRALGVDDRIQIDFSKRRLAQNEAVLLCSDGLTNFVTDEGILSLYRDTAPEELPKALIDEANANGGGDNITAVIMRWAQKKGGLSRG